MNKSEQINELAAALSKLQGEEINIYKDTAGYGYKYAQFSQILSATKPFLSKYELCVSQGCMSDDGKVCVETVLMHSSGQWISFGLTVDVERSTTKDGKNKMSLAQEIGSTITYAKRYGFCSILGIEAEKDTDAAHQSSEHHSYEKNNTQSIFSIAHYNKLLKLIKEKSVPQERISGWLERINVKSLEEIPEDKMIKIVETLEKE